jgi:hypothetical protein
MLAVKCSPCNLYRAEDSGILQGILKNEQVPTVQQRGKCPKGSESVSNNCPDWDKQCGCHGPIMTKGMLRPGCDWPRRQIWLMLCSFHSSFLSIGMVGWAGGGTGPDFFIDDYEDPAKFWGTQHTVWGGTFDPWL